jgi:phosphatidylserine synthase
MRSASIGTFSTFKPLSVESKHFQGLPVPMAAMLLCGMLLVWKGQDVASTFVPIFINVRTQVLLLMFLVSLGDGAVTFHIAIQNLFRFVSECLFIIFCWVFL